MKILCSIQAMANKRILFLYYSLLISLSKFTVQSSLASPTFFPNQTIHDGQSLVSANKTFELGFFSPNGSNNRYVGIWYHNVPVQTVVWVANRETPLLDSSGFIAIDSQGNLIILNSIVSSIIIAHNTGGTNLTSATLLDSGNLILRDLSSNGIQGEVLWQSFDNPTDTLLPGMKLGLVDKENRLVTSWTSPQDPSPGEFSLGIDPNGTKELFIWRRQGQIYWRSGVWNGKNFSLVSQNAASNFKNLGYIPNWSEQYYSYSLKDSSMISRAVMDLSGQVKRLTWVDDQLVVFSAQPAKNSCEVRDYCGVNSICNNNSSPPCSCLPGFEPNHDEQKGLGDSGCTRTLQLSCRRDDVFFRLINVKLPLFSSSILNPSPSVESCKDVCWSNCSCTAATLDFRNGSRCLMWFAGLIGLENSYNGGHDLYVRVANSNQASDDERKKVALIAIPVAALVFVLLLIALIWYFIRRKHIGINSHNGEKDPDCPLFSFATIAAATNNFSPSNKLGEGGFGPVYKGTLEGHAIAAKRLSRSSGQGPKEFKNETTLISNLQHTNLVRLLGYSIQKEEKILIYEYMPNKSLDSYVFDPIKGAQLDWSKRFHIIEGIAQGLLYLHKYSRLRIIHRDLKASNILLDDEMNPKISDFGMARLFGHNENQANTTRVVGTYGYMSPEYAMDGIFSVKSDVFSFGVLLLEIVSGKKTSAFHHSEEFTNLLGYAWQLWKEDRGLELIDHALGNTYPLHRVLRCIQVALLCVQDKAADRPTMSDVVPMLSSEAASLPTPKQPAFSLARSPSREDAFLSVQGICSSNCVTITAVEGR